MVDMKNTILSNEVLKIDKDQLIKAIDLIKLKINTNKNYNLWQWRKCFNCKSLYY